MPDTHRSALGQWSELAIASEDDADLDGWVDTELASELVGTIGAYAARTPCKMHLRDGTEVQLVEGHSLQEEQEEWDAGRLSQRLWNRLARLQVGSAGGADHQ